MITERIETIEADGGTFAAHVTIPETGSGPALLVIQEIFGVNEYIKDVCLRVAALGYVALAPDMFWRQEPGFAVEPAEADAGMARAMEIMGGFDPTLAAGDLAAALAHLRGLPEASGPVGVIGFCFGGTMSFVAAADLDPASAVSYYGSGVAGALAEKASKVTCPILFHFGDSDPFLPNEDVAAITAAMEASENVEIVVQRGAGHAFDNLGNPMFANPDAAAAAWTRTVTFLAEHLPRS